MPPRVANGEQNFGTRKLRRQAKLARVEGWSQTLLLSRWTLGNGNMVGSTTRPPLPNTTLGRRPGSAVLHGSPTSPKFQVQPLQFRTLVLEKLRLPLILTEAKCECGGHNDIFGRHKAACPVWQVEKTRSAHRENVGPSVPRGRRDSHPQCQIADINVQVPATDEREIEVMAAGLSIHHGAQSAVDITLRSAVTSVGAPRTTATTVNGAAPARRDKEAKYVELVRNERCRLVVVALETSGRWDTETLEFVANMASSRARDAPPVLQRSAFLAWRKRWTRTPTALCATAFATSLVTGQSDAWAGSVLTLSVPFSSHLVLHVVSCQKKTSW